MGFLKTDLSRIHAVFALDALFTVLLGAGMALGLLPYSPYGGIHGIAGIMIFPLLLLLPLLSRQRKSVYRALRARVILSQRNFAGKRFLTAATKIVTSLMVLTMLMQLVTGLLLKTGLTYKLFPGFAMLSFHKSFLYWLGALVLLHLTLMLTSKHTRFARKH